MLNTSIKLFDNNFTSEEFRKIMTLLGGTVLILTAINTFLSIRINLVKLQEIKQEKNNINL